MKFSKYYRISVIILIILFSVLGIFIYTNNYVPNEYNLFINSEKNIAYHLPFELELSGDIEGVLFVNNKPVPKDNIQINLNKPFNVKSSREGCYKGTVKLFGIIPFKNIKINILKENQYIPCGNTIGIVVNTDGVLVLGTGNIIAKSGKKYSPSNGKLLSGDYIKIINGKSIENIEQLITEINECEGNCVHIEFERKSMMKTADIEPILTSDGQYKLGIWIRDDTKGIGTLSYIDAETYEFGALGHAITDIDTKSILEIEEGKIVETIITNVNKGKKGNPGEISGIVSEDCEKVYGAIRTNNCNGIYGELNDKGIHDLVTDLKMPIGFKYDIQLGSAYIRTDVTGSMKEYEISIERIYRNNETNKGMLIKVVDKNLLNETNGIVQGMSGSPIIQDGKLIGAITHVFVQDSTKGYGAFIENMILSSE